MHATIRHALSLTACLTLLACGDDTGTGPGPGGAGASMNATVSGAAFAPPALTIGASYVNNVLSIQGSTTASPVTAITINVLDVTGTGTYQLNPNVAGTFGQVAITNGATAQVWTTALSPGNGSITISTLSATRVKGTFTFTAQFASGGATGQKSVTSGTFDIPL